MASPAILDFERLAAPIEGESAVGTDLRSDTSPTSPYYEVKDVRSTARAAERQAVMNGDDAAGAADWRPILASVPEILSGTSKDLELVAYYIEALVREHGFAGLRDGFRLARELVASFGDDIYPLPDEDGIETRVAPLTGLNGEGAEGTLIGPIKNIPITDRTSVGTFGCAQYSQAVELERAPEDVRERRITQGAVDLQTFQAAVSETSPEFYQQLVADVDEAIEEFKSLTAALDERYGQDSPPSSNIRSALEECRETIMKAGGDKLAMAAPAEEEEVADEAAGDDNGAAPAQPKATVDAINTREDAFKAISKVADFFRKTEPHTPISFALDRIVRWGRMPLPELLRELIVDENSVDQMFRLVGIRETESSE